MKNSADLGGCCPPRPSASVENPLLDLQNSSYPIQPHSITANYYSFKIFSRFWLVKTTRIIHRNRLLFTKFGKHLRHIESMTSKVERIENYWIIDVKSAARRRLLNRWPRKPGDKVVLYLVSAGAHGERKNLERNGETPLRRRKYFEWIIKQLLNSAFVGYEEFCRSRRVLSTSAFSLCG